MYCTGIAHTHVLTHPNFPLARPLALSLCSVRGPLLGRVRGSPPGGRRGHRALQRLQLLRQLRRLQSGPRYLRRPRRPRQPGAAAPHAAAARATLRHVGRVATEHGWAGVPLRYRARRHSVGKLGRRARGTAREAGGILRPPMVAAGWGGHAVHHLVRPACRRTHTPSLLLRMQRCGTDGTRLSAACTLHPAPCTLRPAPWQHRCELRPLPWAAAAYRRPHLQWRRALRRSEPSGSVRSLTPPPLTPPARV